MTLTNEYLRATEPVELLAIVGHKPSNTFIGRTQVLDPIFERVTMDGEDELHSLVGGLFYVPAYEGEIREVRFTQPRHIFEKSYGPNPEYQALEALKKSGVLVPHEHPSKGLNYRSA